MTEAVKDQGFSADDRTIFLGCFFRTSGGKSFCSRVQGPPVTMKLLMGRGSYQRSFPESLAIRSTRKAEGNGEGHGTEARKVGAGGSTPRDENRENQPHTAAGSEAAPSPPARPP